MTVLPAISLMARMMGVLLHFVFNKFHASDVTFAEQRVDGLLLKVTNLKRRNQCLYGAKTPAPPPWEGSIFKITSALYTSNGEYTIFAPASLNCLSLNLEPSPALVSTQTS